MLASAMDVVRTRYVRFPRWLKVALSPGLALLPFSSRFGPRYRECRERLAAAEADPELARRIQAAAMRVIIGAAQSKSDFYRERFRSAFGGAVDPTSFDLCDLTRLPVLGRDEVAANWQRMLVVPQDQAILRQTSGSSGRIPLHIYLDRDVSIREMAFLHHIWSRIGYRLGDGRAILRDYGGNAAGGEKTWRYDAPLRELWLSPFHLSEKVIDDYLALLHRHQVRWLYGVPSALCCVARQAIARGFTPPDSLRGILTASEVLYPSQRSLLSDSFGRRPILSFYGMSERVAIAGDSTSDPGCYEFEPLYGITELVDTQGRPVSEIGRRGRIVSTGLGNRGMPMIRYDIGDEGILGELPCESNGYRLKVRRISSKWSQEYVFGRREEPISVVSLDQENYAGVIWAYQYYQDTPGKVVMKVVACEDASPDRLEAMLVPMRRRVADVLEVAIEIVDELPVGRTGKCKLVDQRLERPLWQPTMPVREADPVGEGA